MKQAALLWTCFLCAVLLLTSAPAQANCSNPTDTEGKFIYNGDYHTYQFCNGTNWVSMAGGGGGGSGSAPNIVATVNLTAQGANLGPTTLVTPAADGFYLISCFMVLTTAATTSSTLPGCYVRYTDETNTLHSTQVATSSVANTVGVATQGTLVIYAKSGNAVSYNTIGYATSGATSMQYAIHARLEQL